jgi:hypothetical protein
MHDIIVHITGKTTPFLDGSERFTVDISEASNTHGLPLEIILMHCETNKWVPDWVEYIVTCLEDGHNARTIYSRIIAAVGDFHGPEYLKEFQRRLDSLFKASGMRP